MDSIAKILAIDDRKDNLVVVSALLRNLLPGCEVITAGSGKEGIPLAKRVSPDVILLDIIMPEMDGYEVCRQLKANGQTKYVPVIMLTAVETDTSHRIKGLECGADAFMAKPIDEAELVAQVKVALRIKRAEDQLRKEKDLLEDLVKERTLALWESERRFRSLVENLLVGISIIQKGKVIYQNPEQQRITGTLKDSIEFQDISCVHPDDLEKVKTYYDEIKTGENISGDIVFRFYPLDAGGMKKDMRWIQSRGNRVKYQDEDAILFCAIDITKTKELERLVNIEDKMASLGRVAAGIAHEIRNPLSSINIYLSILQKSFCPEEIPDREMADTVKDSIDKMGAASRKIETVIKRVLDFSRPNAPKLSLMDINQCVKNTIEFSAVMLRRMDVNLKTLLASDLPKCYIDAHTITQVILNLITNAAEAMKEDATDKRITLRTFRENDAVVVSVSDNGPGIPSNIRNKIFDPFYTTKSNGSGIGLCISHRIVRDHGGALSYLPNEPTGAEFLIKLPINKG